MCVCGAGNKCGVWRVMFVGDKKCFNVWCVSQVCLCVCDTCVYQLLVCTLGVCCVASHHAARVASSPFR